MSHQKISLFTAIMLNINVIVGAGILLSPPIMAGLAGNTSFLAWPLCGLLFFPLVWCMAEASKLFSGDAGFYSFGKKGLGPTAGFIAGWAHFLAYLAVPAAHVFGLRSVLASQFNIEFVITHPFMFNALYVLFLSLLNLLSVKIISKIQNITTAIKLIPLIIVPLIFVFYLNPHFTITLSHLPLLTTTLPIAVFAFLGFEASCNINHLIEGGQKNAVKALFYGFYATLILFTVFHFGLLQIMGAENLAKLGGSAFVQFLGLKSPLVLASLKAIFSTAFVITFMSASYGVFLGNSSLLAGMAAEKTLPGSKILTKTNSHGRPWVTLSIQALGTLLLSILVQGINELSSLVSICILIAFLITICALLKSKGLNFYRTIFSILGLISCSILGFYCWQGLGTTTALRVANLTPAAILMASGLGMYFIQTSKCCKTK